jgi:hypothetical protein
MADAANLWDLAARITADTKDAERSLTDTQKKVIALAEQFKKTEVAAKHSLSQTSTAAKGTATNVTGLSSVLKNLSSTTVTMQGPLGGVAGRLEGLQSLLSSVTSQAAGTGAAMAGMAGPIGIAVAGIVATAAAAGFLLKQLIDLSVHTADWQGKMVDLSQQVGIGVETLSALEVVAATTGGSMSSLIASLGIFQKKMEEANDVTSKTGKLFKDLGITSGDTETALRQAISTLGKMPEGYKQTAAALELFGRGGKAFLAVAKETNGDLDKLIARLRAMGIVLSKEAAEAADKFNDQLAILGFQARAIGGEIGAKLIPMLLRGLEDLSGVLKDNQAAISAVASITKFFIGLPLEAVVRGHIGAFRLLAPAIQGVADALNNLASRTWTIRYSFINVGGGVLPVPIPEMGGRNPFYGGSAEGGLGPKPPRLGGGGRGGKGGGGGAQKDVLEGLKNVLIGLNAEFRKFDVALLGSANSSALAAEKEKILTAVMSSLKQSAKESVSSLRDVDQALDKAIGLLPSKSRAAAQALRDQALAQFALNEQTRIAGELAKQVDKLFEDWKDELDLTRQNADEYTRAIFDLEKAYAKYGQRLSDSTRRELEYMAAARRTLNSIKELTRERRAIAERPRVVEDDNFWRLLGIEKSTGEETRPRKVTGMTDEQRAKIQDLARTLTDSIDRAIYDGFQGGVKKGLASLLTSLLDMIRNVLLKQLEAQLTAALSNINVGGGKGGILSTIFGIVLGGLAGGISGGGGASGTARGAGTVLTGGSMPRLASGLDFVPYDNFPALLHKGERVVPASENRMGGATIVNNWYVSTPNAASFAGRDTQAQLEKRLNKMVLKPALVG